MGDAKHTRLPWTAILGPDESAWMVGPGNADGADYVADVHRLTSGRSDAESDANARLIAAAPELVEALLVARRALWNEAVVKPRLFGEEAVATIDAALAKAGVTP
jgi:hypothetical protein